MTGAAKKALGWGTWTAERPVALTDPETGFSLAPVLYSDRAGAATELPPGPLIRYGPRAIDGRHITFETLFEDTRLDWVCALRQGALDLSWRCQSHGEWGLRYWVCLCLSGPPGTVVTYDTKSGAVSAERGVHSLMARPAQRPLLVTAHADVPALAAELTEHGYFYLASRAQTGPCLALRYNLDEAPQMTLSVALSPAGPHTPSIAPPRRPEIAPSRTQEALEAVHDVLAWNHVYDPVNSRPYTALTRNWSQKKFGGFGVWLNDTLFLALLWSLLDPGRARENLEAVFAHQTDAGNFPCLVTGNDAWLDRSQLPMASYVVWALYRATGDTDLLRWAYPKLRANHRWWWDKRALGDTGFVAYGTSAEPGDGLYKGTKLAAKNESAMDNSAVHDEAGFDPETGLLQSADVGLNSLLALDAEVLSLMARALDRGAAAQEHAATGKRLSARIQTRLWDDSRGVFANRLADGRFVTALAPTSFFPLVAGAAREDQAAALITGHLEPEEKFGGALALPSAPRDQPAFQDNSYWRGRIWGPLNYWVYQGLLRYGRLSHARELAQISWQIFETHWAERRCGENYSALTGEIHDQPDADDFYTWGALLPALSVFQSVSDAPWSGSCLTLGADLGALGPIHSPLGVLEIETTEAGWTVRVNGVQRLSGTGAIQLEAIEWGARRLEAYVTTGDASPTLCFPGCQVEAARFGGRALTVGDPAIAVPSAVRDGLLEVTFRA